METTKLFEDIFLHKTIGEVVDEFVKVKEMQHHAKDYNELIACEQLVRTFEHGIAERALFDAGYYYDKEKNTYLKN